MERHSGLAVAALVVAVIAVIVEIVGLLWPSIATVADAAGFRQGANRIALGVALVGIVLGAVTRTEVPGRRGLWLSVAVAVVAGAIVVFTLGAAAPTPAPG